MAFTKITAAGIGSTETVTIDGLSVINNVSIAGTLTYEDVTNIDSVGLITARAGVVVGSGITLSKDGDIFATGVTTSTTFVGALTGAATRVTVTDQSADTTCNVLYTQAATGDQLPHTGTNLTFNSNTGALTATSFNGDGSALTGVAATDNVRTGILDVAGIGTFRSDVFISENIDHLGDDNTRIRFPAADTFSVDTGGSERIRIDSAGQIQINTDGSTTASNISLGVAADLKIYHDGDDSYISNGSNTGLIIRNLGNSNIVIQTQNSYPIQFKTNGTDRAQFDASGRLLLGTTNVPSNKNNVTPSLNVSGSGVLGSAQITRHTSVGGGGALLHLAGTRGSDVNSYTILQNGDGIGTLAFNAADGNEFVVAAEVSAQVDGTPGDNDMPGRLIFKTTADGASSPTERMRIHSGGVVSIPSGVELGSGVDNTAANTLDDYEEGTANATFKGADGGSTSLSNAIRYTKIGNLVHVVFAANNFSNNGVGGTLEIAMPFTSTNAFGIAEWHGGDIYWYPSSKWDTYTNHTGFNPFISANNAFCKLRVKMVDSDRQTTMSASNNNQISGASGLYCRFSITYEAA